MDRPLIMLIPYFGHWPAWIELFVESCKWNPEIHWRIYTDCGRPQNDAPNVEFVDLSFADYKALAGNRLGIRCEWSDPYKLCDLKPCLGHVHEVETRGYRFFGYGDIDVIYGNIRAFYTDELLARYDVISTHPERIAGHFAVFRNNERLRRAYELIPDCLDLVARPQFSAVAEGRFSGIFLRSPDALNLPDDHPLRRNLLFVERYSTVLSSRGWHDGTMNYPRCWFWRNGRLTNDRDDAREFLYLHFMRWQSKRWTNNPPAAGEGAWLNRDVMQTDWHRAGRNGFCISAEGFSELAGRVVTPDDQRQPSEPFLHAGDRDRHITATHGQ